MHPPSLPPSPGARRLPPSSLPQWLFAVDRGCDVTLRYENLEAEFAALADSQANLRGLRLSQARLRSRADLTLISR